MAEMEKQNYNDDINRCGRFPDDFQNYTWELDVFDMEERRLQKIILTVRNEDMKTHNIYRVILCKPRG
ncbi:MAG: hypothetical protein JW902_10905 [Syntrophaceae bacterium]|nr:hypothetical protein [Syntrophaceae bacterium]